MRERLVSIQVIRAIAFILIFLSHVDIIYSGPIGVSLFLVISGFCMTYAYFDRKEKIPSASLKSSLKFGVGKIKKLYPLHLVTLLAVALMVFAGLFVHKAAIKEWITQGVYLIANGLLVQSWIPLRDGYFSFNAVSWYLSTTVLSYILFPWVFQLIQSKKKKNIVILTAVTLGMMILIAAALGGGKTLYGWSDDFLKWVTYICPAYRAGDFIIGLIAGYVFITAQKKPGKAVSTVSEILLIILMALLVFLYGRGMRASNWTYSLLWLPTSVAVVYIFAGNKGVLSTALSKCRPLVWIGNISGEAFLIHQICIKAVEAVIKNKAIIAAAAFALTLICTVIWRFLYKKVKDLAEARRAKKQTL